MEIKTNYLDQEYAEYNVDKNWTMLYFLEDKVVTLAYNNEKGEHRNFAHSLKMFKRLLLSMEDAYNYPYKKINIKYVLSLVKEDKITLTMDERMNDDIYFDRSFEFNTLKDFKDFICKCEHNYNKILEDFPIKAIKKRELSFV